MHRVALVVDPSPPLLRPLVHGLGAAGYDVAFSAPPGADRPVLAALRGTGRRGLPLDRSAGPDRVVARVRDEFGRLDLVVVEPERAEAAPRIRGAGVGTDVAEPGHPALGAARGTIELLGRSGGSIVRILRAQGAEGDATLAPGELTVTRDLGRVLAPRIRVNALSVPRDEGPAGVRRESHVEAVVRAVLYLAGAHMINGEVLSIGGPPPGQR